MKYVLKPKGLGYNLSDVHMRLNYNQIVQYSFMNILSKNSEIEDIIKTSKSDSGISGKELRIAHIKMGHAIAKLIAEKRNIVPEKITVITLFRAGFFFGQGIADELDCVLLNLDEKNDKRWINGQDKINQYIVDNYQYLEDNYIILADAVINTGKTILEIHDTLKSVSKEIAIATCVIQSNAVCMFDGMDLFVVRVSENKYVGTKVNVQKGNLGPDTGDRLFRTL